MRNNPLLHLKYFFDVGSGICLWVGDSKTEEILGYAIELEKIEISENTKKWLTYLIHWFDTSIDWDEPTKRNRNWTTLEQLSFQEAYKKAYIYLLAIYQKILQNNNR